MVTMAGYWAGRSVFITGHTGFKGSWLSLWLNKVGAKVHGYALDPNTDPSLFRIAQVGSSLASDTRADLADFERLALSIARAQPEVIFHLAAQPLVRESYRNPLETFATNIMGTANLLEASRGVESIRAIVVVTTDKVYGNDKSENPHREGDALGGRDPYSASKAAAELVVSSYRASFFATHNSPRIATARAGNVIGGGDWAVDRLVPDCLRAFAERKPVRLRYPTAIRPWQHVLEPLSGYMCLAEHLANSEGSRYADAWNFGPDLVDDASVGDVAQAMADMWGMNASVELCSSEVNPHETATLSLDSSRAQKLLGWRPRWPLTRALKETVAWQRHWIEGNDMRSISESQIESYLTGQPDE
ncbi:CDP-glucose 4,6-dehydratase [Dyella lipolytica]|nr:CDP-glucose 4,6-dehydratase [Dyella lipolytica]